MPLIARHQIVAAVEDFPGTEQTTIAGSDVVDTLLADFSQTRTLNTRQPASNSMSKGKESIGRGEANVPVEVDVKGSGTALTAPDWGKLLESCLLKEVEVATLEFDGSQSLVAVRVGDIITDDASDEAACVVVEDTASGADSIKAVMLTDTTFGTSTAVVRRRGVDSNGDYVDTALGSTDASDAWGSAVGVAYKPASQHELTFAITAPWAASDPAEGENIRVTSGGNVVGEVLHISSGSGTTVTCEPLWGEIPASATLESTSGKTATVHGTPALTQTVGKRLTILSNRDRLKRPLIGVAGSYVMAGDAGSASRISFEFKGKAGTPDDAAHQTGASLATTTPPRLTGDDGFAYVDAIGIPIKSYSHTVGNNVVLSPNANESEGDAYSLVTARDPELSLNVDQLGVGGYDWWTKWKNGHSVQVGFKMGTSAGNTIVFCATNGQIDGVADDDTDGIATHTPLLRLRKYNANGDDEFVIAHI